MMGARLPNLLVALALGKTAYSAAISELSERIPSGSVQSWSGADRRATKDSNATITAAPTISTTGPPGDMQYYCDGTSIPIIVGKQYQGLYTSPDLQCQCMKSLNDWVSDTATHTIRRTDATGATTITETISGTPTTRTTAALTTFTLTVTGNGLGAGIHADGWYGSAEPPCVRYHSFLPRPIDTDSFQCYSCTVQASTVQLLHWASSKYTHITALSVITNLFPVTTPHASTLVSDGYTLYVDWRHRGNSLCGK